MDLIPAFTPKFSRLNPNDLMVGKTERPPPEEIIKDATGDDASVELSKFRTRMSEHRTDLSEHRTDLSEHRTSLSENRTKLSLIRTHLSNERTHLSYLRTGVSLISFGISINRFSKYLIESGRSSTSYALLHDTKDAGIGMVVAGVILLVWSLGRYFATSHRIDSFTVKHPRVMVLVLSTFFIFLGAATATWLILG